MACNCATQEQINLLYKQFGEKIKLSKQVSLKNKIKLILTKIAVGAIVILISPLLFLYVVYKDFDDDRRISFRKFFRLDEEKMKTIGNYVREQ